MVRTGNYTYSSVHLAGKVYHDVLGHLYGVRKDLSELSGLDTSY